MTINEKHQHNLGLPISRMPNEILSRIFCDLRNQYVNPARPRRLCRHQHGFKCLNSWIGITHVCHVWREVALNASLLWCHIDVSQQFYNWTPELLRRSKQSPLTLVVEWAAHKHGLLGEMKRHFERARELVLDDRLINSATMHEIFSSQTNFQNLETLDISLYGTPFILNDSHLRAERLRRLNLLSCPIDWNSKFLRGLTHLRLDQPTTNGLGCRDLTFVLSKIPALETLHLSDALLESDEDVQTHQVTKVHLQHLQRLYVASQIPEMAQFISSLIVPRSCKLRLFTWHDYPAICDRDKFHVIFSWISNQFRVPATSSDASDHEQYIRSFRLVRSSVTMVFKVEGFCDVLSHEQLETADPILTLEVDCIYEDDNFDLNLRTFLSLLPLSGVTFLEVHDSVNLGLSPKSWRVAFGSIQTLKTIYLDTRTSHFWQALTPANGDNKTVKSLPFPALASVAVVDPSPNFKLVLDKLRVRSDLGGTQLQDLRFTTSNLWPPGHIMIQLGKLVSHIRYMDIWSSDTDDSSIEYDDDED